MSDSYGLHWFRRDLRVAGNGALRWSVKRHQGRVLGLFCFDKKFLARSDFSHLRFQFFLETLVALAEELRAGGGDLLFLDEGPEEAFGALWEQLKRQTGGLPESVSWNRDYEPFALARDQKMETFLRAAGVTPYTDRDHVLIEPSEIFKGSDPRAPYQVYTPYQKKWLEVFSQPTVQSRLKEQQRGLQYLEKWGSAKGKPFLNLRWADLWKGESPFPAVLESYRKQNATRVSIPLPPAGSLAAYRQLQRFGERVTQYAARRDWPAEEGTSRLSIYFKNGSLTPAQAIAYLNLGDKRGGEGRSKYLAELIWREFYYYILAKFPWVEKEAFQRRYNAIPWENREDWFTRWKEGRTGFPIVDAGMRELNTTGWMHNRVRMIVASFLTKDLMISWQWGERYFMEKLLDGDLAPNNGGWQWAASTGCDAQPYFRVFNPWLQGERFDPEGTYIRRYVPELADLPAKTLHSSINDHKIYPAPLVEHSQQRVKAIEMYKKSSVV